jgi:hypothetical protein
MGHGANMAVQRTAFDAVGGFDEGMGPATRLAAAEDQDLFWRLLRDGWCGAYDPRAVVVHQQWRGTGGSLRTIYRYGVGAGALAVKMARLDGRSGRTLLRRRLVEEGVQEAARELFRGHEAATVHAVVKVAGVVVGGVRAARAPLAGSQYRPVRQWLGETTKA